MRDIVIRNVDEVLHSVEIKRMSGGSEELMLVEAYCIFIFIFISLSCFSHGVWVVIDWRSGYVWLA